ncbi:hypothetical protein BaRGS_00030173, partial [Batillaria attramentaria]
ALLLPTSCPINNAKPSESSVLDLPLCGIVLGHQVPTYVFRRPLKTPRKGQPSEIGPERNVFNACRLADDTDCLHPSFMLLA